MLESFIIVIISNRIDRMFFHYVVRALTRNKRQDNKQQRAFNGLLSTQWFVVTKSLPLAAAPEEQPPVR